MVHLWEIFLRSAYLEVFGIFHKPSVTTQILRGQLPVELALGICMHSARYVYVQLMCRNHPLMVFVFQIQRCRGHEAWLSNRRCLLLRRCCIEDVHEETSITIHQLCDWAIVACFA
jgi:hypothetical protein